MLAAHAGHAAAVRVLLALGADADQSAKYGLTALMLAVLGGHAAVVHALLERR
jgi:ankyrin repeat protein